METGIKPDAEALEEKEIVLSKEQEKEIVTQELMELPAADRIAVGEIIKDDVLIRINGHKKKLTNYKRKYAISKIPEVDLEKPELLDVIKEARREMRNFRVPLSKEKLAVTKPMRDGTALINGKYDPVIDEIKKVESPWDKAQDEWEEAIEAKKLADAQAKQKILEDRIKRLEIENCAFDGSYYVLESKEFDIPAMSFGIADLQTMSDELFEDMFAQIQQKNSLIQDKIAEKKAEETRIENERLENERLAKLKFAEDQRKIAEAQKVLDDEKKALDDEKREMRTTQLVTMGLTQSGNKFSYEGKHVALEDLASYSAADWATTKQTLSSKIDAFKANQKAAEELAALVAGRKAELTNLGLTLMEGGTIYGYKGRTIVGAFVLESEAKESWDGMVAQFQTKLAEIDAEVATVAPPVLERPTRTFSPSPAQPDLGKMKDEMVWETVKETLLAILPEMETAIYKEKVKQVRDFITGLK